MCVTGQTAAPNKPTSSSVITRDGCQSNRVAIRNVHDHDLDPLQRLSMKRLSTFSNYLWDSSTDLCVLKWPYEGRGKTEFTISLCGKCLKSAALGDATWHLLLSGFPFWRLSGVRGCWKPWHRRVCKLLTQEPFQAPSDDFTLHTEDFEESFAMTFLWAIVVIWPTDIINSIWPHGCFRCFHRSAFSHDLTVIMP